ncbi:uncharacterized protein LOC133823369 [Humulus lupulus]|uniref:uncharacterized protein LOC133823369 n=1 Tax=Humulus lupulus TaxID=3486 RepID=UPI002B40C2D1|nr:uncharacterized protein LOC133823369 [Humulus lupulus]
MVKSPFWVQVFRLPFLSKSESWAKSEGHLLGDYIEVDKDSLFEGWRPFMRIRVAIDVTQPLMRGRRVRLPRIRDEFWIDFRYEKLPDFCFECGIIGHLFQHCTLYLEHMDAGTEPTLPYGPWLKGAPLPTSADDRYRQDFSKSGPWPFLTRLARSAISPILTHPSYPSPQPVSMTSTENGTISPLPSLHTTDIATSTVIPHPLSLVDVHNTPPSPNICHLPPNICPTGPVSTHMIYIYFF